jgi:ELWxxDGT repeat protein
MRPVPTCLWLLSLAVAPLCLPAQSLVKDIRTGSGSSNPTNLVVMDGAVYFVAETAAAGVELWRSDGTTAGTTMVADINATPGAGAFAIVNRVPELCAFGSTLLFWANDGTHGQELWRSDGTAAGTQLVLDIVPGTTGSDPFGFTVSGNQVFFFADTPATGLELWVTDGTAPGTHLVLDFWPGTTGGAGYVGSFSIAQGARNMVAFGTGVLFSARANTAPAPQLCFSDGTAGGTSIVTTMVQDPRGLTPFGGGFLCHGYTPASGYEPWFTDGTAAGTLPLADRASGNASSVVTNGLTSSPPQLMGGRAWFVANASTFGYSLWSTDGTPAGTNMFFAPQVADPFAQVRGVRVAGDRLYLEVSSQTQGTEMYVSDGISQPTLVVDLNPGTGTGWNSYVGYLAVGQGRLAITTMRPTDAIGDEPCVTNGTAAGTYMLTNLATGNFNSSSPREYTRLGGKILFSAQDNGTTGRELYSLDVAGLGAAEADGYGTGCAGTGGLVPGIAPVGAPVLGNTSFAVRLSNGLANAPAALFFDFAPAAIPVGPCTVWIQALTIAAPGPTDGAGVFQQPLPLVGAAAFVGLEFWGQGFVLDGNGLLFGGLGSLSGGLHLRVGY